MTKTTGASSQRVYGLPTAHRWTALACPQPMQPALPTLVLHPIGLLDVAAASGIALREGRLYVIADDELDLAVYDQNAVRLDRIALLAGSLPTPPRERKAAKPDFEALLALDDGALLALGSGSTPRRMHGSLLQLGAVPTEPQPIDLSDLYTQLLRELPELNIEGGAVLGEHLYLASRGNGPRRDNALVRLDLARSLHMLRRERALGGACVIDVRRVQLGELLGTPLSLTDLAVCDGGLVFAAAAEASANTYDDGECQGSVLGRISERGVPSALFVLEPRVKIEGLCSAGPETRRLWAVADADDPSARAPLFSVNLP